MAVAGYSSDTYSLLMGRGDATFAPPVTHSLPAGSHPTAIAAADLNGDGKPDLVVANSGTNSVSVLIGSGNGSFAAPTSYPTGTSPSSLLLQDIDADAAGDLDLALTDSGSNSMSLLMNNGDGTFQPAINLAAGPNPTSAAWVLGMGFAVTDIDGSYISVLLKTQVYGTAFNPPIRQILGATPRTVTTADFDRDGTPDRPRRARATTRYLCC